MRGGCDCEEVTDELVSQSTTPQEDAVLFEDALASVSRAVIGAVHQIHVRPSFVRASTRKLTPHSDVRASPPRAPLFTPTFSPASSPLPPPPSLLPPLRPTSLPSSNSSTPRASSPSLQPGTASPRRRIGSSRNPEGSRVTRRSSAGCLRGSASWEKGLGAVLG